MDYAILGPLLTSEWDQGNYYNALCPVDVAGPGGHVWTGCVATAMAQVMKYHNFPSTGVGSHSYTHSSYGLQNADFGSIEYDWASMQLPKLTVNNLAAATLMYHAGVAVNMDYAPDGSAASTEDAAAALKTYFKYSESISHLSRADYTDIEWNNMLLAEINNSRPVIYRGSGTGGHAFVCDGYNNDLADDYFHFNWGWSGAYNGYFYLNDLTPGSYNFTADQAAIFGITPTADPSLSYPYSQNFEGVLPVEWLVSGERVSLSTADAHTGNQSLLLSTTDGTGLSNNSATIHINVPPQGAVLSFWVKRGYSPAASVYNNQQALLKTQFGDSVLTTFYNGDYNDTAWQQFSVDLSPWAGSNVKLFLEQYNDSSSYSEWTYLDDVTVMLNALPGDIDANGVISLTDVIIGLQLMSGSSPTDIVDTTADMDGDARIGLAEVIYALRTVAGM